MERFKGKVCVITASSTGIGFAIAQRLGREGGKIVVSSRNAHHVQDAVSSLRQEGIEVAGVVCHVSTDRKKLIEFAVATFGGIDVLVNNAAASVHMGNALETTEAAYDKMFDVNVKSGFFLVKEALPWLQKSTGSVLFVASTVGYRLSPVIGIYSVTKLSVVGLVKMLAPELMRDNIRVNGIAPGVIKTRFSEPLWDLESSKNNPYGRIGTAEECASVAAFLCCKDSSFITGETIVVSGGEDVRL